MAQEVEDEIDYDFKLKPSPDRRMVLEGDVFSVPVWVRAELIDKKTNWVSCSVIAPNRHSAVYAFRSTPISVKESYLLSEGTLVTPKISNGDRVRYAEARPEDATEGMVIAIDNDVIGVKWDGGQYGWHSVNLLKIAVGR